MSAIEESAQTAVVVAGDEPGPPPVGGPNPPGSQTYFYASINGTDITSCCLSGSITRRLNRPAQAMIRVPMDCAVYNTGDRLRIDINGQIYFHGMITLVETDTGEDFGYTVYNAADPMELWQYRPVRDDNCSFMPKVGDTIIDQYVTGPQIIEAMLLNSAGLGGCAHGDCEDADAADCEGTLFLTYGTFEGGGVNLTGAPTDWPQTMAELSALLISTGCVDIYIEPTDPGGGIMGEITGYNGDFGSDLSGSVVFEYGTGAHNVRRLRWNEDMSNMCNKLWYFSGPRCGTVDDPAGDQHYCFNVQGDDPDLPVTFPNGTDRDTWLAGPRMTSRSTYGVRMDIQIFDAFDEDCCGSAVGTPGRDLYRNRWETESFIRAQPRELIHITPTRDTEIGTFNIGDLVGVTATSAVRGGFSGAQRVYEFTIAWDEDSVLYLDELQTSDTADS